MIRIGLVDDDWEHLRLMRDYLARYEQEEAASFQIEEYHNGLNFTEDYDGQLDIVFLDIEMPHMDGMTAARKVRERDASLAIIFLSRRGLLSVPQRVPSQSALCHQHRQGYHFRGGNRSACQPAAAQEL